MARAEASRSGTNAWVFVELQDVNYPGSTYTLDYESVNDQLHGIYYHAVSKQRLEVSFRRTP